MNTKLSFLILFLNIFLLVGCGSDRDNSVLSQPIDEVRNSTSRGFGVSGLLFENNLIMYDREHRGEDSELFPQMYFKRIDAATFPRWGQFPTEDIVSGGVPRDGIPAVEPIFVDRNSADVGYLSDTDLVLGVVLNGEIRAYPHNILWWHEIMNDKINGQELIVTLCPLTGTGMVFSAPDRSNDFKKLQLMPVVETTWGQWQRMYPNTKVVSGQTGFNRDYTRYPYSGYRTENSAPLFPLRASTLDNRFPPKHVVLGILEGYRPKAYPFSRLQGNPVINDEFEGRSLVIVSNISEKLAVPYERNVNGEVLTFAQSESEPFRMIDSETNSVWNIKGQAISGSLSGAQLQQIPAHNAFWFAWAAFWPTTEVFSLNN